MYNFTEQFIAEVLNDPQVTIEGIRKFIVEKDRSTWNIVEAKVKTLSDDQLGLLCAEGDGFPRKSSDSSRPSLYEIHNKKWGLNTRLQGRRLLEIIATTSVMAIIYEAKNSSKKAISIFDQVAQILKGIEM